ncbi:DUF3027 domain-containing protein [Leucobacter rhizosphaerae]|uniref:DUF3027 domain-containing protein n=1 Tax=Leucobacter rhizosphaerae TaxID=2932245 RepID=A0ABY4FUQ2_9MICO|nr:DUF3027 domain-containing protein [Leucobacter rhizosphaerae]UOQ59971.1 DUF3027 domain-containing protein [Leucobacter rhizosphaerae]
MSDLSPQDGAEEDPSAAAESGVAEVDAVPPAADPVLLDAREQARTALLDITDAQSIGVPDGHEVHEEHVLTLFFECRLPGYPGWRWAATLARVDEESPVNVLEVELLPGAGAVIAPEWVPWSERLAQYREAQTKHAADEAAAAEAAALELHDDDEDDDAEHDLLDNDYSDFDDEIDGVDVDAAGGDVADDDSDDDADEFEDADLDDTDDDPEIGDDSDDDDTDDDDDSDEDDVDENEDDSDE